MDMAERIRWTWTVAGQQCKCNSCGTQFYSKDDFSYHFRNTCLSRIKSGYIEAAINPS